MHALAAVAVCLSMHIHAVFSSVLLKNLPVHTAVVFDRLGLSPQPVVQIQVVSVGANLLPHKPIQQIK